MKKVILMLLVSYAAITNTSCKKTADVQAPQQPEELSISKTTRLMKKEPVKITLNAVSSGATVKWTVNPPTNVLIRKNGNSADFQFLAKGTYTITANYGSINTSREVSVGDTTNTDTTGNGGGWNPADSTGGVDTTHGGGGGVDTTHGGGGPVFDTTLSFNIPDSIAITPFAYDTTNGIKEIFLKIATASSYPCSNNYLDMTSNNTGTVSLLGVKLPANCMGTANKPAENTIWLMSLNVNETKSFTIEMPGTSGTGTITRTTTGISITFSGVPSCLQAVYFTKLSL